MKKYMKLIGSLMIMMCMAVGIFFNVTDSQASEETETRLWLTDYAVDENGVPSHEGYLFAGYYEETEDTYTAIKSIEGLPAGSYCAKFVPKGVLGIKAQVSGNILKDEVSDTTKNMIRFVTSIDDSLDYQKVGFKIDVGGYANIDAEVDEYVFEKIYAVGATEVTQETYEPSIFDSASKYFKTWTFTDVPEGYLNTDITVTPYWVTMDGTTVYGTTTIRTANYCRGWFYVNSSAYVEGSANVGTYNSPATLETAVAIPVNTELVTPVAYLQSDVTINETVNVTKTMTIESLDTAKTITYDNTTSNMINVTEDGNLTLNVLNLNGGNHVVYSLKGTVETNNVIIQKGNGYGYYMDGATATLNNAQISGVKRGVQLYNSASVSGVGVTITGPIEQGVACGSGSSFDITTLAISGNTSHAINAYGGSTAIVRGGTITEAKGNAVNVPAANVTLNDVNISYAEDAAAGSIGINAYTENDVVSEVLLNNVNIEDAPYCGIQLSDGVSGTYTTGTVSGSGDMGIHLYDTEQGTNGASLTLDGVNINNSTQENLYVNYGSTATVKGTLSTEGGTSSLAIYNGGQVIKGENYSKIEIKSPNTFGVRLYNPNSKLNVGDIILTNCVQQGIYIADKGQANFDGNVSIQGASAGNYDCLYVTGESSKATVNGTLTTTGGRHGFAIFNGGVVTGNDNSVININSPRKDGVNIYNKNSALYADNMNITGCGQHGVLMGKDSSGNPTTVTLTGDVKIENTTNNAFHMELGTLNASYINVMATVANTVDYGFRAYGGNAIIGELDVDGASAFAAVRAEGSAEVTINGGTIKNSVQNGVNVLGSAKLYMTNVEILNSTSYDIYKEGTAFTISLTNVTYSTEYSK